MNYLLMEAIASTAASHEEKCDCLVCRAAQGDEEALAAVWTWWAELPRRDDARPAQ